MGRVSASNGSALSDMTAARGGQAATACEAPFRSRSRKILVQVVALLQELLLKTKKLLGPIHHVLKGWRLLTEIGTPGSLTAQQSSKGQDKGREAHHFAGSRERLQGSGEHVRGQCQ